MLSPANYFAGGRLLVLYGEIPLAAAAGAGRHGAHEPALLQQRIHVPVHGLLVAVAECFADFAESLRLIRAEVQNHEADDLRVVGAGNGRVGRHRPIVVPDGKVGGDIQPVLQEKEHVA